jgi:hypothetical protein
MFSMEEKGFGQASGAHRFTAFDQMQSQMLFWITPEIAPLSSRRPRAIR